MSTEAKEFQITDELMADMRAHPEKIRGLPSDQRIQIMAKAAEAPPEPAVESPEPPPAQEPPPEGEAPPEPKSGEEGYFRKAKRTAKDWEDRANTAQQRADAEEKRLERLKTEREKLEKEQIEIPQDLYTEENQGKNYEQLQKLTRKIEALETYLQEQGTDHAQLARSEAVTAKERATYRAMEELQDRFPNLKTQKPIPVLDKEYGEFLHELESKSGFQGKEGLKPEQVRTLSWEKWKTDPEFQKQVTRKPPEELEKLSLLLMAQNRTDTMGGTLKGHLLDLMDEKDVLPKMFERTARHAAEDATTRTLNALSKGSEIKPLGPNDGVSRPAVTEDAQTTVRRLIKKKQDQIPWTPADRAQFQLAHHALHGG